MTTTISLANDEKFDFRLIFMTKKSPWYISLSLESYNEILTHYKIFSYHDIFQEEKENKLF